MPTYEYECLKCKKRFDQLQRMTEAPIKKCIFCHGKVLRLIGAGAGLIFKGSGFYATDYKNKSSSSGKPETKPEVKEVKKEKNDKNDKRDKPSK